MTILYYKRKSEDSYFPGLILNENEEIIYKVAKLNNRRKFEANILYPDDRRFINITRREMFIFLEYKITFEDNTYAIVASSSTKTKRVFDLSYHNEKFHFEGSIKDRSFKAYVNKNLIANVDKHPSDIPGEYVIEITDKRYQRLILALIIAGIGERELNNN